MDQKKLLYSILPCNSRIPLRRTKSTVLRSIFGEIEDAMVSEKILDYLETIGEVDRLQGLCILESMKKAYCTVAVECTVRYLSIDSNSKGKYVEVVERIWRNRIRNLEKSRISELLSDELTEAWEEIEAAVWDENVCSRLRERNTRNSALISVIAYLEECSEYTGDEKEQEGKDKETRSLEVRRVLEARKDSSLELQAAATDLITEALYVAEFIAQEMTRENAIGEVVDVEEGTMEASHAEEAGKTACEQVLDDEEGNMEAGRAKEAATSMPSSSQSNASRGSLMERNNSTQTYEWNDSIENNDDYTSRERSKGIRLSSPKITTVSPLRIQTPPKIPKRRKPRKWSLQEAEALRYGVGCWTMILKSNPGAFEERTAHDLKDKWRVLTR